MLVQTRLNAKVAKRAKAAAEREGLSMAAWVRRLVQASIEAEDLEGVFSSPTQRIAELEQRARELGVRVATLERAAR